MSINTYIGARYVPLIMGPWSANTNYEPLSVVLYNGGSYTSICYVPAGNIPTNTQYWAKTGDYNAQVEQYRQEVINFKKDVDVDINDFETNVNGQITSFKNTVNTEINRFEADINQDYTNQQKQIDNLVLQAGNPDPTSAEIVQARAGYATLNSRLESMLNVTKGINLIKDFNDAILNRYYLFTSMNDVANAPTSTIGTLACLGDTDTDKFQLWVTINNDLWMRRIWGTTWTSWKQIADATSVDSKISAINAEISTARGGYSTLDGRLDQMVRPYQSNNSISDANIVDFNAIYLLTSTANVANLPTNKVGTLVNMSRTDTDIIQTYVTNDGISYTRHLWGGVWSDWNKILYPSDLPVVVPVYNVLTAFSNYTCIGDSLTWGQVYTSASTSRQAYVPYPKQLERLVGGNVTSISFPGDTTSQWWGKYNDQIVARDNNLTIVYLGTNGGLTDTLDVDAPAGSNWQGWSNTNTGCYAKIAAKSLSLGSKVVLIKLYATSSGTTNVTNQVIEKIGQRFGCAVVGPIKYTDEKFHSWPNGNGVNSTHYNDVGYAAFTKGLIDEVGKLDNAEMKLIIPN